jgi:hypothetical protein
METVDLDQFDAESAIKGNDGGSNGGGFDLGDDIISLVDVDENASDFDPIPAADYECFVVEATFKESKAGNPMVEVVFEVDDNDDERGKVNGRRLWHYCTLHNDRGKRALKKAVLVLNPNVDMARVQLSKIDEILMNGPTEGRCRLKVVVTKQKNKDSGKVESRNNIRDLLPLGGESFLQTA